MTYQSMLNFCKNHEIGGDQIYIAYEMDYQLCDVFEIGYTEKRFEQLCDLAHYIYLKADDISMTRICIAIATLENDYRNEEGPNPIEMSKWDILDKANEI